MPPSSRDEKTAGETPPFFAMRRDGSLIEHDLRANAFRIRREGKPPHIRRVWPEGMLFSDHALEQPRHGDTPGKLFSVRTTTGIGDNLILKPSSYKN
jgi:hypothetical protein